MLLALWDSVIVLYFVTLCPFLFCNHLDGKETELVALLSLSFWCFVIVVLLFLTVPRVCLQFVIVIFRDHTHYFGCHSFERRWLWRVCKFESRLRLSHCTKTSRVGSNDCFKRNDMESLRVYLV